MYLASGAVLRSAGTMAGSFLMAVAYLTGKPFVNGIGILTKIFFTTGAVVGVDFVTTVDNVDDNVVEADERMMTNVALEPADLLLVMLTTLAAVVLLAADKPTFGRPMVGMVAGFAAALLLIVGVVGWILVTAAALLVLITTTLLAELVGPIIGDLVATMVGDFASSSEDLTNAAGDFLSATSVGLTVPLSTGCAATFRTLIVGSIITCLTDDGGCLDASDTTKVGCFGGRPRLSDGGCLDTSDTTKVGCFGGRPRPRRSKGATSNGFSDTDSKVSEVVFSTNNRSRKIFAYNSEKC